VCSLCSAAACPLQALTRQFKFNIKSSMIFVPTFVRWIRAEFAYDGSSSLPYSRANQPIGCCIILDCNKSIRATDLMIVENLFIQIFEVELHP